MSGGGELSYICFTVAFYSFFSKNLTGGNSPRASFSSANRVLEVKAMVGKEWVNRKRRAVLKECQ